MHASVGYSDNPDTSIAGMQAAMSAIKSGKGVPCDLVLLFSTTSHDPFILQSAVASVIGPNVPIYGGGALGAISAAHYGYAGDQIILTAIWLEGVRYHALIEKLDDGEEAAGARLGERLKKIGIQPDSNVLLFYDSMNKTPGQMRMFMATPLLAGIKKGLGFFPELAGAGLQGDYLNTPSYQWTGSEVAQHAAMAFCFEGDVRIDTVIMHGCHPSTYYYTVTKADYQTILEINHEPALSFMQKVLGSTVPVESYPFFLILGINQGDKWGDFDEESYASRLCLAIDKERNGIVMFEPDMVEGTEFQIMARSMELSYMPPRMEKLFQDLGDREPFLALYINCGGRAAGYAGTDIEDALVVQKATEGKVPLMGMYSGVEIAPVKGQPRGLDWTGVFCLFSRGKAG